MSVGTSKPHDSAALHVTGAARYLDDIPLPANALHLAFGLSPIACGQITELDLSAVRAAPGVVAVFAGKDLGEIPDCSPSAHDEPLLSDGSIHYLGQPVFLVAATSHLAARKAVTKAEMRFDEGRPVFSYEEAAALDQRFEDGPRLYAKGDAARAISEAAHVIEGRIEMGGQEHFYLEGQAALALPQEGGDMVIHSSSQHPTEIQHKVAHALHLPMHAVRVEVRRMGGGFGGKESQGNHLAIACALVAKATGRPAKMRYDRDDDMMITGKRHDFRIGYRVGVDREGRIEGIEFTQETRGGWAQDLTLPVADRAMLHADNAYHLRHAAITSHRWRTNRQSATAYRGFGGPQGVLGIERVMDHIAHELGVDPLLVRQRNYYADAPLVGGRARGLSAPSRSPEDISGTKKAGRGVRIGSGSGAGKRFGGAHSPDPVEGSGQSTPYHMEVVDFELNAMTERLAESCGYEARREAIAQWNAREAVLKKGIAITPVKFGISFTLTHLNQAGALVHVYQDGSIHLNHGGTEMGQGLFQKVAQVAASRFGVGVERVRITATDTGKVPNTSATAASSGTDLNGMAVKDACDQIRARMAAFLAAEHGVEPEAVHFDGGHVHLGATAIPFDEAAMRAYQGRVSLSAAGFYKTPDIAWDRIAGRGQPFFYFAQGVACSEVVIDTLTGENRILRCDILHDAGASLNPALDIGQVEGGFVQGAGWLTTEELVWDDKGRLRTHAPSTYKIPACSDRPDVFNVSLWESENRAETIYRSKAVGEPPFMHGISVFLALSHAISACGPHYPDLQAPATAEEIMAAIARARG